MVPQKIIDKVRFMTKWKQRMKTLQTKETQLTLKKFTISSELHKPIKHEYERYQLVTLDPKLEVNNPKALHDLLKKPNKKYIR